jgi:hypothetical protein
MKLTKLLGAPSLGEQRVGLLKFSRLVGRSFSRDKIDVSESRTWSQQSVAEAGATEHFADFYGRLIHHGNQVVAAMKITPL